MVNHYDRVIVGMGVSLIAGFIVGVITAVSLQIAIFGGSIIATLFMYDAIIRNPPIPASDPRVATSAIVWHLLVVVYALEFVLG